jgi:hypothetical protein
MYTKELNIQIHVYQKLRHIKSMRSILLGYRQSLKAYRYDILPNRILILKGFYLFFVSVQTYPSNLGVSSLEEIGTIFSPFPCLRDELKLHLAHFFYNSIYSLFNLFFYF